MHFSALRPIKFNALVLYLSSPLKSEHDQNNGSISTIGGFMKSSNSSISQGLQFFLAVQHDS